MAVALPVDGTFTYRDPRGAAPPPVGSQVVVPFGRRTVTGFVVGHPAAAPAGDKLRDIESVVAGAPPLDDGILALCRFAAGYYLAPLGEVLRAALPQGERAIAQRTVRLTDAGARAAAVGGETGAILTALLQGGGALALARLERLFRGAARRVAGLAAQGLVEVGDAVTERRAERVERVAVVVPGAGGRVPAELRRTPARRMVFDRVASGPDGLPVVALLPRERAQLKALVGAGLLRVEDRAVAVGPAARPPAASGLPPTAGQAAALEALLGAVPQGFATFLLFGVTGSGKTEVYLQLIEEVRRRGRGALVLVPEIALTPQLATRFRARFGDDVAVLHSALRPRERLEAWRRLRAGEVGIAVGARSAVFAPVHDLGVVVVDEEHDPSFKQEEGVRYHGRDLAVVRAQRAGALAILGSATPSLESWHNAEAGRFRLLRLPERATPRPLPAVEVVDLRRHPAGPDGFLSPVLAEALAANLAAGEQSILFLNRRGFSTVVLCRTCGFVIRCPHCAVSMTYHRGRERLVCHYCARVESPPTRCPSCGGTRLERLGMGTERVESLVRERFPDARVARLDRDTADATGEGRGLLAVLAAVQAGEIDILVGTQMVTKGHDFGGVTLVGVLAPDQGMHLPDFRAAERTFQLLEQVAGRAGRGRRPGRVIIQTHTPDHPAITCVLTHDYEGFARGELERRREAGYPPFVRMAALRIDGPDERQVRATAFAAAARAGAASGAAAGVRILGPAEAPIARVRGRARWQIWLAAASRRALAAAAAAGAGTPVRGDVRVVVDVDPVSVL